MAKQPPAESGGQLGPRGNYIAEWFGHRVWQQVDASATARANQPGRICPFLSVATRDTVRCIKEARAYDEPTGVCTISSDSNGIRQDWLACPFRVLDQHFTILGGAIRTIYNVPADVKLVLFPVTVFNRGDRRAELGAALGRANTRVFAFCADKLGGEVDIPETDASPGNKVDVSVIEITGADAEGEPNEFGQHVFFEIQTADFHGSPLHAVRLLAEKCPQGTSAAYHPLIAASAEDCGSRVEGPNKANIFKRTIYQMILKMELANTPDCAGFVIVLPVPVWQSWLRHLGQPTLETSEDDPTVQHLRISDPAKQSHDTQPAWIFVFDIDRDSTDSPQPLKIIYRISTTPDCLIQLAFRDAPKYAITHGAIERFRTVLLDRVHKGWLGSLRSQ